MDPINVVLDIGYTLLFNYIECNVRLFGFDLYQGFLHQEWFNRKSLVCDFIEPFRGIIDKAVVRSFNLKQFKSVHFYESKNQYFLKKEHQNDYYAILMKCAVNYKEPIFIYIKNFYIAFMQIEKKRLEDILLPVFDINDNNQDKDQEI